jgi:hypothetical protein
MKKFFIALSVLAALMLSVVPSQALIGMPDDTAGTEAVVPFICDISGTTGLNTLIMFMDSGLAGGIDFHYTILTKRSKTVYDDNLVGTPGDIVATDAFTEMGKMAPAIRAELEVDLSGDGVNDHYAGYIYYQNLTGDPTTYNSVVGQFLLVNLPNGIAAASNIAMKEWKANLPAALQPQMAPFGIELFSPNALAGAMTLQDGNTAAVACNTFGIYPRFYIQSAGDATWLIFWMSQNDVLGTYVHLNFWDDEENVVSSNIPMTDELTIIDVEPFLPESIFPKDVYPKEGWVDLYWDINPATNYPFMTDGVRNLEFLGWSYLQAKSSSAQMNWTVMTPMWRDDVSY